ncbi:hypothetical protein C7999DRAFT_36286 [Corynascus novoguineensis]|uniref:Uncharacterized protein n=1 Tax=Corynascus novoguineensis TaxID=1126955 RepID=A0AAN7HIG2_9PEZI|nr:hypothetical protein C7999DRAFT_36286 [Corynascus novoguineensis]
MTPQPSYPATSHGAVVTSSCGPVSFTGVNTGHYGTDHYTAAAGPHDEYGAPHGSVYAGHGPDYHEEVPHASTLSIRSRGSGNSAVPSIPADHATSGPAKPKQTKAQRSDPNYDWRAKKENKQRKAQRKAERVASAQAEGYEQRVWSPSMQVLYDEYKILDKKLHDAKQAYWEFKNSVRKAWTIPDHEQGIKLATEWKSAAKKYENPVIHLDSYEDKDN